MMTSPTAKNDPLSFTEQYMQIASAIREVEQAHQSRHLAISKQERAIADQESKFEERLNQQNQQRIALDRLRDVSSSEAKKQYLSTTSSAKDAADALMSKHGLALPYEAPQRAVIAQSGDNPDQKFKDAVIDVEDRIQLLESASESVDYEIHSASQRERESRPILRLIILLLLAGSTINSLTAGAISIIFFLSIIYFRLRRPILALGCTLALVSSFMNWIVFYRPSFSAEFDFEILNTSLGGGLTIWTLLSFANFMLPILILAYSRYQLWLAGFFLIIIAYLAYNYSEQGVGVFLNFVGLAILWVYFDTTQIKVWGAILIALVVAGSLFLTRFTTPMPMLYLGTVGAVGIISLANRQELQYLKN